MNQKILFIDRDGTLISKFLGDVQINCMERLALEPDVIPALLALQKASYRLVMITHLDSLSIVGLTKVDLDSVYNLMMGIFTSQGIFFDEVLICSHILSLSADSCARCKLQNTLVTTWLHQGILDNVNSYVISNKENDMALAANMGISGLRYQRDTLNWLAISNQLTCRNRYAHVNRVTQETAIDVEVWLDRENGNRINTGIGFFDHMLDQIATHSGGTHER